MTSSFWTLAPKLVRSCNNLAPTRTLSRTRNPKSIDMPPKKEKVKKPPAPRSIEYRYTPKLYFPRPTAGRSPSGGGGSATDPVGVAGSPGIYENERAAERQNMVAFLQDSFRGLEPSLVQTILEDSGWREDVATETLIELAKEASAAELQQQYGMGCHRDAANYWDESLELDRDGEHCPDDLEERMPWLTLGVTLPSAPQLSSSASPSLRSLVFPEGAVGCSTSDQAAVERTLSQAASRLELQKPAIACPDLAHCRQASPSCRDALPRQQQQQRAKSADIGDEELYNDLDCRLRLSACTSPRDGLANSVEAATGTFKNILTSDESCEPTDPNALSWRSSAGSSLASGTEQPQLAPAMQRSPPPLSAISAQQQLPQHAALQPHGSLDVHYIQLDQGDIVLEKGTFLLQRSDPAASCTSPAGVGSDAGFARLASLEASSTVSAEPAACQGNPSNAGVPHIPTVLGALSNGIINGTGSDGRTTDSRCSGVSCASSIGDVCLTKCGGSQSCTDSNISCAGSDSMKSFAFGLDGNHCSVAGLPTCMATNADLSSRETLTVDSTTKVDLTKESDRGGSSVCNQGSSGFTIVSDPARSVSSCAVGSTAATAALPATASAVADYALASVPAAANVGLTAALPSSQKPQQQFNPAVQACAPSLLAASTAASTLSSASSIYSLGASAAYMTDRRTQQLPPAKSWSSMASVCAQSPPIAWSAPLEHKRAGLSTQPPCNDRAGRRGAGGSADNCLQKLVADIRPSASKGKKILVLLRGCPGSGKSTLARSLKGDRGVVLSTDDYFMVNGKYEYDYSRIGEAHDYNRKRAERALKEGVTPVVIDNTNTMIWEMGPYASLALTYHYRLELCEPATEWKFDAKELFRKNSHGVPLETIQAMIDRYEHNVKPLDVINFARRNQPARLPQSPPAAARDAVDTTLNADFGARAAVGGSAAAPAGVAATQVRPLTAVGRNKMTSQTIRRNCVTPDVEKFRNKDFGPASPVSPDASSTSPVDEPSPSAERFRDAPIKSTVRSSTRNDAAITSTTTDTAQTAASDIQHVHTRALDSGAFGAGGRRSMHTYVDMQSKNDCSTTLLEVKGVRPQLPGSDEKAGSGLTTLPYQATLPEMSDRLPEPVPVDICSSSFHIEQQTTSTGLCVTSRSCSEELSLPETATHAVDETAGRHRTLSMPLAANQAHRRLAANLGSPLSQLSSPPACTAVPCSATDVSHVAPASSLLTMPVVPDTSVVASSPVHCSSEDATHRAVASTMVEQGDLATVARLLSGGRDSSNGSLVSECAGFAANTWRVVEAYSGACRQLRGIRTVILPGTPEAGAVRHAVTYPTAVCFDKSTMTDDEEVMTVTGGEEVLSSLFPQVPLDDLRYVLSMCKGDISWATNMLLDSGCDCTDSSAVPSPNVPQLAQPPTAAVRATQRTTADNAEKKHLSRPHHVSKKRPTYRKLAPQCWASFYSPPRGAASNSGVHLCYSGTCRHPEHSSLAAASAAGAAESGSPFSDSHAFVSLTLTAESILRLIELFGSLGNEAVGAEDMDALCCAGVFDVQLPLGLAQQLHGAIRHAAEGVRHWNSTMPGGSSHRGGRSPASQWSADSLYSAQGSGAPGTSTYDQPDTTGDEELARRLQREENCGAVVQPPPLYEIMDAQLAEHMEQEQQQAKSAFGSQMTMAERLRRQQLYKTYPSQPAEYLDSVFESCGRNLQRAADILGTAQTVNEQGASHPSSATGDVDDEWEDVPDEPSVLYAPHEEGLSSTAAPDQLYHRFRAKASQYLALKKECTRKAIAARSSGRAAAGPVVAWYREQARNYAAEARRCHEAAAQHIFNARNPQPAERDRVEEIRGAPRLPLPLVLDLHGLHASEAVSRVRSAIESARSEFERLPDRRLRSLTLITGKGSNSRFGIPRVKRAVMTFLLQKNVAFSEVNEGVLKLNLYRHPAVAAN